MENLSVFCRLKQKANDLGQPKIDRRQPPPIHAIDRLQIPEVREHRLRNGMPLFEIRAGSQEVIKLEVVFHAGRPYEAKPLAARTTAAQIKEGTARRSSAEIDEHFDFYGSSLNAPSSLDTATLSVHTLNRYTDKLLPVLGEVIAEPAFAEKELQAFIQRNRRRLQVDLTKPDVVAYRQITECIFGKDHPYGYNSLPEIYEALERADLIAHHRRLFTAGNGLLFVSGKTSPALIAAIDRYLGAAIPGGEAATAAPEVRVGRPQAMTVPHPDRVQTAIRIGRRLFNRRHPDHHGLYVLNTILGGYFGSRLMANIREDKGYTYNVYSMLDTMLFDGCFYVGTEVGNEFVADTLRQIYHEMEVLQTDLIGEEELAMVRNYLMGSFLTMLDGPFNIADLVKTLVVERTPLSTFHELVETVRTIRPDALRELARKYLRREDMWEVVVGGQTGNSEAGPTEF